MKIKDILTEFKLLGYKKTEARAFLDSFIKIVNEGLRSQGEVYIDGLGKFYLYKRPERKGTDPVTHDEIIIPSKIVPKFTPSKNMKDHIVSDGGTTVLC